MAQETIHSDDLAGFSEMKRSEQLGILVLDGSGSMTEPGRSGQSKGLEVQSAVRDLISRLQVSTRAPQFFLAIVTYCNLIRTRLSPTAVDEKCEPHCDPLGDYDPTVGHGGATAIGDALLAARQVGEEFLAQQGPYPRQVVIVLMSDGGQCHGSDPRQVVQQIKSNDRITIATCAFGNDADEELMKDLATDLGKYLHAYNLKQLRDFFLATMTTAVAKPAGAAE